MVSQNMVIKRYQEIERIKNFKGWILIYGRRKTGKTFFVKNFLKWDEYYFVTKSRKIMDENWSEIPYDVFVDRLKREVDKKVFVIDEFHRLGEDFLDFLHFLGGKGKLILISSVMYLIKKIFGRHSPITGLIAEFPFGLVDERDILLNLERYIRDKRALVEASVYLREPWFLKYFSGKIREDLAEFFSTHKHTVQSLLYDIFEEEEREITPVYLSVLEGISDGKNTSSEIAGILESRNLIEHKDTRYVQQYLKNLFSMGLIEKIKVYQSRMHKFYHISPLFDIHFYLEAKYGYLEENVQRGFIKSIVNEKVPRHLEQFFRNLLSKLFGMKPVIISKPNLEVDIALTEFQKLKLVGEVKWKKDIERNELRKIEEKLNRFKGCKKILIVPDKDILPYEPKGIEVWDVKRILREIKRRG